MLNSLENSWILSSLDERLQQVWSRDIEQVNLLVDEILRYDPYDFIGRVSELNLLAENQTKNTVFNILIELLLLKKKRFLRGAPHMSQAKFKKIMLQIFNTTLPQLIDPPDNSFVDRVRFYGNKWIFPGINYSPAYSLQAFIDVICFQQESFNRDFLLKANRIISFVLDISDQAANLLHYTDFISKQTDKMHIKFPNEEQRKILHDCVYIDFDTVKKDINDSDILDSLFYDEDLLPPDYTINPIAPFFLSCPFLKANEQECLLLDPSALASFLVHRLILLADTYCEKKKLIDLYNRRIWADCNDSLIALGCRKIKASAYSVNLISTEYRKEAIYQISGTDLLILHFICDSGSAYTSQSMFGKYRIKDNLPDFDSRSTYFCRCIPHASQQNIYHLIILNSFGRELEYTQSVAPPKKTLRLSPFELACVAINEKGRPTFISKYIDAKLKLFNLMIDPKISELNAIALYASNSYSFYFSDDIDLHSTALCVCPEASVDYVIMALKTQSRHLVASYDNVHLADVVLLDGQRNIFRSHNLYSDKQEWVVELEKVKIWLTTPMPKSLPVYDLYHSLLDTLSYWIASCRDIINQADFIWDAIRIDIFLSADPQDYYILVGTHTELSESVKYKIDKNTVIMEWSPASFQRLQDQSNTSEKKVIASLLSELNKFTRTPFLLDEKLDYIFKNPSRKKIFAVPNSNTPLFRPTNSPVPFISSEDTNILLDDIGSHFLNSHDYSIGTVPDDKKCTLINAIVGYLYNMLQKTVASLKPDGLIEMVYLDLESVMYEVMMSQAKFTYDVSCYPEKEPQIIERQGELNQSSIALKFLIEYLTATPPTGDMYFDASSYDRVLAICHLIVIWAYQNDLIYYHITNTPIEFLKSGRVGMKHDEINFLSQITQNARTRKLNEMSSPNIDTFIPEKTLGDLNCQIDDAFLDEYGFSFKQFAHCIAALVEYVPDPKQNIRRCPIFEVISHISNVCDISQQLVEKIIDHISLGPRDNFLKPSKPYKKEDVYPWRFNRELSFTRRPIIRYETDLIWGPRQLYHMFRYTNDLLLSGKYKAGSAKLRTLIGQLSNSRGNEFNHEVATRLQLIDGLDVYEQVSKINGKRIAGPDRNALGDIDVLCIFPSKKKIIVGEVKDFSIAKNPYELEQEYKKIFVDGDKPCFLTKHHRRVEWIKTHIDDVISQYHLPNGKWAVRSAMFVSDDIISKDFFRIRERIVVYTDISDKIIKDL